MRRFTSKPSINADNDNDGFADDAHVKTYKELYEDLLIVFDKLKKERNHKEMEWNKENRSVERRMSEFEEDLKRLERIRSSNMRLKEENTALVRVISKLAK